METTSKFFSINTPVTFSYDKAGNLTGYDDGTTSAVYTYDEAYRKTGETVHYPGYSLSSAYTYYKNGLKKSFTGPDGNAYGFLYDSILYDSNNQLTGVQIPNVGMFTVNEYKWNRPAKETLPGGAQRLYGYIKTSYNIERRRFTKISFSFNRRFVFIKLTQSLSGAP